MADAPRYVTALQTRVMREHMDIHIKHMKARHGKDSMPCFFIPNRSLDFTSFRFYLRCIATISSKA